MAVDGGRGGHCFAQGPWGVEWQADVTSIGISSVGHIYTPHALPMFRDEGMETKSRAKRKERNDPVKSQRPGPTLLPYPSLTTKCVHACY